MAANSNLVLQLLITAKDEASSAFGKLFGYLDDNTKVISGKIREAFSGLFGGGLDGAIEFEAQLDRVAAKGGYTQAEVEKLKASASALGAQFGLSGTEAAQGMESLAAAGLTANEAIATLPQVLALASAEQISADAAAQKLIDSLSIMGLGFEEAGRMADVLAKGANITTSSASQLAEALSEAGGTAKAAGLDLEVTVAALDLLHKNGIKGSEAGTALKAILTALLDPASKASTELDALGITSRDLGTVMGELKGRGDAASTAILAFGTEAGPGLRALIGEGQEGLNDYTTQLRNAEGAAALAASEMGGNLKSALDALASGWDSLKAALLDPLLAPITKQVKDLAAAFQEGLSSEKFQAVQETIRAFGEATAQAIGDFIRHFDFNGALNEVASFATSAKAHFAALSQAANVAAGTVQLAWNGVTATFQTIGAGMTTLVASIVATLANIEEAAAKVGLGSVQRANELRETALNLQRTATELLAGAGQSADAMGAAFTRMTAETEKAKTAVNQLKTAVDQLPDTAATLTPVIRTLADYKAALDSARVAQTQAAQAASDAEADYLLAGQAMDAGTGSAYRYEEAAKANRAAQLNLKAAQAEVIAASSDYALATQEAIRGIDAESAAVTRSIQSKQDQVRELEKAKAAAKAYADAQEGLADAQNQVIREEIALAEAKGDTAKAQELAYDLAIREAEGSARVARAKWEEEQAEAALAIKKLEQLNAIRNKNAEQRAAIELAVIVAQRELAEAKAAGVNAERQAYLAQKLREVNAAKAGATAATAEYTAAAQQETTAQGEQVKVVDNVSKLYRALIDHLQGARQRTSELSAATGLYFEAILQGTLAFQGMEGAINGAGAAWNDWLNAGERGSEKLAEFTKKLRDAQEAAVYFEGELLTTVNMFDTYATATAGAERAAEAAFYEQALAAENLRLRIIELTKDVGTYQNDIISLAGDTTEAFNLLDEEDLSGLQSAIDAANDKLRQMQEETQSARERLAELNAEILEEQGQDQQAELLRQQLDYQQQLAELEAQRQEAAMTGNRELLELLGQQESKLSELNRLKVQNIQADATGTEGVDQATRKMTAFAQASAQASAAVAETRNQLGALGGADLGNVLGQFDALRQNVQTVNDLL